MRVLLEPINACHNDHGDSCNQQSSQAERNHSSNDHLSKLTSLSMHRVESVLFAWLKASYDTV